MNKLFLKMSLALLLWYKKTWDIRKTRNRCVTFYEITEIFLHLIRLKIIFVWGISVRILFLYRKSCSGGLTEERFFPKKKSIQIPRLVFYFSKHPNIEEKYRFLDKLQILVEKFGFSHFERKFQLNWWLMLPQAGPHRME